MSNLTKLFEGDPRCANLLEAINTLIYERGLGIPIPSILGVLELVKVGIIEEQD